MAKAQYIAIVYANSMDILTTRNVYRKISFKKFPEGNFQKFP